MNQTARSGEASAEALTRAIAAHELWLDSKGAKGARIRFADHPMKDGKPPRLVGARLDHADARDADVSGWRFEGCSLCNAEVDNLRAKGTFFHRTSLSRISGKTANFDRAVLVGGDLNYATIETLSMAGARLTRMGMVGLETRRLVADNARMDGVHGSIKVGGSGVMRSATLEETNLSLELSGMDLSDARVNGSRLVAKLAGGAKRETRIDDSTRLGAEWRGVAEPGHAVRTPVLDSVMKDRSDRRGAMRLDASRGRTRTHADDMRPAATMGRSNGASAIGNERARGVFGRLSGKLGTFRDIVVDRATKLSASMRKESIGVREVGPVIVGRAPDASAAPRPTGGSQMEGNLPIRALDPLLDGESGSGRRAVSAMRASGSKSLATAIAEAQARLSEKSTVAQPAPKRSVSARRNAHEQR